MKTVVITGASTGIGYDAAVQLAKRGYQVFAGVRKQEDADRLKQHQGIEPVILDVTKPAQIDEFVKLLETKNIQSLSLVNNAGIAVAGAVEVLTIDDYRKQFEVNFFGLIQMTQKLIPLIRKHKGRIVNISSVSGLSSTPFLSAYSASKYALEALSDSMRWEFGSFGVKVVVIEPGPILTPIWQKGMDTRKSLAIPEGLKSIYQSAMDRFTKLVSQFAEGALPVERVSKAIIAALEKSNPPTRIMVVAPSRKMVYRISKWLPEKAVDKAMDKTLFK